MTEKIMDKERVARNKVLYFTLSLFSVTSLPYAIAGPEGGQVVGGTGSIAHSGNTTTINQSTQNMAIDWQSYNVNVDERVQYIQPNSSSVSLNRILSQNGSTIAGRIDANGQVILVNPNGIFFTPTSIINVGGIIASGLNIQPNNFMNGSYIFDEMPGTDGTVINSGIINASLGGNVTLIGKQVKNDGLIVANLGTVNLAAGKQTVLTFDQGGLLGVRVSKEILQEELGIDPAVINSGDIQTQGGRVLLTASTSQNVFSQAVNTGDLNQSLGVVMHEDGSFTLGGGADVINTGSVDVSTITNDQHLFQSTGRIVLLGENVTSSGVLNTNAENGNGGDIELHAQNTALLTENSVTTARSETNGQGGSVKILGDNVGLFDQSMIDASGANGGGQVFIGGGQEGNNALIPNSEFIYLSEDSQVFADALDNGDGGRVITFASDSARIYGDLFARGGVNGGDGGFIETSGLRGFEINSIPDTSAASGRGGVWLIDPYSITINNNASQNVSQLNKVFESTDTPAEINILAISGALDNGSNVIVRTGSDGIEAGDIIFDASLNYDNRENATLTLDALGDIRFMDGSEIFDFNPGNNALQDALTLTLHARGEVTIEGNVSVSTQGGSFFVGDLAENIIPTGFTNNGTINTSSASGNAGGNFTLFTPGDVNNTATGTIITGGGNFSVGTVNSRVSSFNNAGTISTTGAQNRPGGDISIYTSGSLDSTGLTANGGAANSSAIGQTAGAITLDAGTDITLTGSVAAIGSNGGSHPGAGGAGGAVNITSATGAIDIQSGIDTSGGNGEGDNNNDPASGGNAGAVILQANNGTVNVDMITANGGNSAGNDDDNNRSAGNGGAITISGNGITFNNNLSSVGGEDNESNDGDGGVITLNAPVVLASNIILDARGAGNAIRGDIRFNGTLGGTNNLTLYGRDINVTSGMGNVIRLGDVIINASGVVDVGTNVIAANKFTVDQATSFNSGTIDTANAGNTGGIISITAGQITLDDDLNASGTTDGTIDLILSSVGSVTLMRTENFTSPVTLTGSAGTDMLTAANRENSWSLTSTGSILNNNFTFSGIETLVGNAQGDTFILPGTGTFTGTLNGGGGSDTLQAGNRINGWAITGNGTGTVTGLTGEFTDIEILAGGNNIDTFDITAAYSGNINGGDNNDIFDIRANASGTLQGGPGNDTFNIRTTNTLLTGTLNGDGGADTLNAANENNYWTVDGINSGAIYSDSGRTTTSQRAAFLNIENLTGNSNIDDFLISTTGSIAQINGVDGTNTLTGRDSNSTWTISDTENSLTETGTGTDIISTVANINILNGGTAVDTFTITAAYSGNINGGDGNDIFSIGADVSGRVRGGQGNDRFEVTAATSGLLEGNDNNDTFNLSANISGGATGGQGNDTFNILTTNTPLTGTLNGNQGTDTLQAANEANYWTVNSSNGGAIYSGSTRNDIPRASFSNIENLIGNGGIDDFLIGASGSIAQVDGGAGTGANTLTGRNAANEWDVSATNGGALHIDNNTDGFGASYVTTFTNIQNLTGGNNADRFVMGASGIITGTIDGTSASANTLVARQGVVNLWDFDTEESGSLTRSGENSPYVNAFTNIQNFVGGGAGSEWADFSANTATIYSINADSYFGFTGIIGNGANSTLNGQDGQSNNWTVQAVIGPDGTSASGGNDGRFSNNNGSLTFIDFSTLIGGNNNDTFTITGTGRVGRIDGGGVGSGGVDEIRGAAGTGPVTWTLGSTNSTVDNGSPITFTNIQTLTGANDTSDTFNFTVTPANTGVATINGGSNSDTTTTDTVSVAGVASGAIVNVGAYQGIEIYIGNAGSTLEGGTGNTWTIENIGGTTPGMNDGRINASTNFYDFGTVLGGSGTDTFTFVGTATIGSINGGGGANSITGPDGTYTLTLATATDTTLNIDDDTTTASTILGNIQTLNGGTGADTFVVNTTATASGVTAINGGVGNDIFVFSGALPATAGIAVSGQADTDTLDLSGNAGTINVTLNQYDAERIIGNSNSTFTGLAGTNTWSITPVAITAGSSTFTEGQNDGTIINGSASQTFIDFNNLTGGNGSDIFTIETSGNLDGLLNGGGGTGNTLTILNTSVASAEIAAGTAGASSSLNITGINDITGNSVTTLISDSSVAGDWTITGANAGTLNGMTFSNFTSLQGGTNTDTFRLHANIDFAGSIDGGITGTDEIIAGNRATNNWVITGLNNTGTVTGVTGNFSGIETLTGGNQTDNFTLLNTVSFNGSMDGGNGNDQLTGGNGVNIWTINGSNAGGVTGLGNGFTSMEALAGGSQPDTFSLSDVMIFNGTISGGTQNNDQNDRLVAGNRENDWVVTGANNTGTVTGLTGAFTAIEFLDGNNRRDTLALSNTDIFNGSFNGAGGVSDEVIGGNTTNNWAITAANNTGTVTGLSGTFTRVEALTGTSAQDTFTLLAGTRFDGDIDGGAGSVIDTLVGGATTNSWVIDGTNGNTVTGLGTGNTFGNIQNLNGATGAFDDTFIFRNAGSIAGSIDGGGQAAQDIVDMSALNSTITVRLGVGQDVTNVERVIGNNEGAGSFNSTLVAENNRNMWSIDGINDGTVDGVQFINFNNLRGGTGADTFVVSGSGDITGLIDGGSPTRNPWVPGDATPSPVVEGILQSEDILDYSALATVDIIIDTDFSNIERVKGNANGAGTGDSTLGTGATGNNNWLILGTGTGVVNSTQFADFNNIVGGNGDDTFVIEGDFGGSIRGGGGGGTDTVNYQALDTFRVVFGGELGITDIERVEGDGSGFTIVGRAGFDNTWTISGSNQGDVTAGSETLAFIGFDNIEGNDESAYTDTFTVQGGSIDGSVLGMAGDDALIVELTGSETGQLFFNGGAGTNTVLLQDGATTAAYRGEYTTGITGGYDQLQYSNVIAGTPRIFTLNYQQAGQVQDTVSANLLTVNGTPNADMIELGFDSSTGMNTFSVNGATAIVQYSNKDDLTILGLGDLNDTVNITTDTNLVGGTGVLTINAETVTSTSTITANQLVLDSVVTAGTASAPVNINVMNLGLSDSANMASQALYLQEQNGLTLTRLGAVESVDINVLDGSFTNSVALTTNSQLDISTSGTTGGNIVLTGNNQFSGDVTLDAANDIIFDGDNTFSGTTGLTARNNISSTGANTITGSVSLDATTIDLSGDNQITTAIVLSGTMATINNTVATDLGNVTAQNLTVTSTDNITDSGVINVQAVGMGQANFTATNGNIVLDNVSNNFDVINLVATNGAVTVNEADGISIITANISGALNVISNIGLAANDASTGDMVPGNINATTINLNAGEGAIVSQPGNLLTADVITLTAASGIGGSVAINTNTSTLSVINASFDGADELSGVANVNVMATSGVININNTGDVIINDLRNYGDILLTNSGNITLNVTSNSGAINASYGGNNNVVSHNSRVVIRGTESSNFSTLGTGTLSGNADIIADNLFVDSVSGGNISVFGTQASPIGLRVNNDFTLRTSRGAIYYLGGSPGGTIITTANLLQLAIQGFVGISSQQLIDIETLGEIDQAIFTEVRNYNYDDIAIRLPGDQDYGDDDEQENGEEKGG